MNRRLSPLAVMAAASVSAGIVRTALATPPNSSYRLVFADEFDEPSLDTAKWLVTSPTSNDGWTMPASDSTATPNDVTVNNGYLTLSATRTGANTWNSGALSTYGLYNMSSGYIEARIQLPSTPGSWPAFWGLYTGWPPESDIMEYPYTTDGGTDGLQDTQYNTNYHYVNSSGNDAAGAGAITTGSDLAGTWHTFGMQWISNTSVAFYLDGTEVSSYTGSAVSQMASMYMILDYAVGGWPGTPSTTQWPIGFTDQMNVDWVRVWQTNPNNDAPSDWTVNGSGNFNTASNWSEGVPMYGNEVAYFGRVGTASTAAISTGAWQVFGGITFDGSASGTTAYTLGSFSSQIQLASTASSGVLVQATAASTVSQTIAAGVELWSNVTFTNNMTGGEDLNIDGPITGSGEFIVNGAGTVVVGSGNNTFTGNTLINNGTQGPAILEATTSGALGTGSIVFNSAGNSTTGQLQLIGNATLSNPISLSGRNVTIAAIDNIADNNTLSGTIGLNVGGGDYLVQSDSGTLILSGAAGGGVAITGNGATGARTVTLQGAGNGNVTGQITNGTATISLLKAGSGTWTLSDANTFTGSTTVTAGTLLMDAPGALGSANVSITGGTLALLNNLTLGSGVTSNVSFSSLAISGNGTLDITNNHIIIDYGASDPIATIASYVRSGASGGPGILSSTAYAPINGLSYAVGFADGADGVVAGLSSGQIELKFTLLGDANLDGTVNGSDFSILAANFGTGATNWDQGNFLYGTSVNGSDFSALAANFGQGDNGAAVDVTPADFAALDAFAAVNGLMADVPEPTSLAALACAGGLMIRRQTRKRKT
jgi:autotransporter-associated beta strand protein